GYTTNICRHYRQTCRRGLDEDPTQRLLPCCQGKDIKVSQEIWRIMAFPQKMNLPCQAQIRHMRLQLVEQRLAPANDDKVDPGTLVQQRLHGINQLMVPLGASQHTNRTYDDRIVSKAQFAAQLARPADYGGLDGTVDSGHMAGRHPPIQQLLADVIAACQDAMRDASVGHEGVGAPRQMP